MNGRCVQISAAAAILIRLCPMAGAGEPVVPDPPATWDLKLLGVAEEAKLARLRDCPKQRRVKLAVVGQGGVSKAQLQAFEAHGHTSTYHDCTDPGSNSHDTAMTRCVLEKLTPLGVQVDLHLWQPGQAPAELAADFREAGEQCDIVSLYQSFWGSGYAVITDAIRESPCALFISPYVGYKDFATNLSPQGAALKPWVEGSIGHFVTVTPLARRNSQGRIVIAHHPHSPVVSRGWESQETHHRKHYPLAAPSH